MPETRIWSPIRTAGADWKASETAFNEGGTMAVNSFGIGFLLPLAMVMLSASPSRQLGNRLAEGAAVEMVERVAAVNHGLEAPSGLGLEPHSARGSSDRS